MPTDGSFAGQLADTGAASQGGNPAPGGQTTDPGNTLQDASQGTPQPQPSPSTPQSGGYFFAVPDDMKDDPSITKFIDPETGMVNGENALRSYKHAETLIGGEKVAIPKHEDDEEGWQRVYTALGRPEDKDGYNEIIERPEIPEGVTYQEEYEEDFKDWCFGAGLNKKQAQSAYQKYLKHTFDQHAQYEQYKKDARDNCERALRREWGRAYDAKTQAAQAFMQKYADPDFVKVLQENGLDNDPRIIRMLSRPGEELLGEEALQGRSGTQESPAVLQRNVDEFRSKYYEALHDSQHPEHRTRVEQLTEMTALLYGE